MNKIYLSKRNLLVLLSKLNRLEAGEQTACTVVKHQQPGEVKYNQTMKEVEVIAVPDAEYYGSQNRPAGSMHPKDEPREENWIEP